MDYSLYDDDYITYYCKNISYKNISFKNLFFRSKAAHIKMTAYYKKKLKIPKNRQRNGQKNKQQSTKHYTLNITSSSTNPTKNRGVNKTS